MKLSDHTIYRIYEILPGAAIWLTLILAVVLSFFKPLLMVYFIILFDIYWVLRVLYFVFYLIVSWRRFRIASKQDWQNKLETEIKDYKKRVNVVFLPYCNEGWEVVRSGLQSIVNSTYDSKMMYIVVSGEARFNDKYTDIKEQIGNEFKDKFADIVFYTHPKDLPGEIPGKGSNINYAEKKFKEYINKKGWNYANVIVSIFDIDTVVHPKYFAHLTYIYCLHPRPERSSFQPLVLYNNNIWESPSFLRIMAFGTSFWILFSLARLDNMVTFSSHSMSYKAIDECGGHAKDIVSEDSRIFFQCWLRHNGDYEVTPLYIPVSMYTVRESSLWKSLKNLYLQQRRWAWGVEHIPYLLWQFRKNKRISLLKKIAVLFHEWEGKWSWAVVAIMITIVGQLPLRVINYTGGVASQSTLFFNAPFVLEILMTISMMGLIISAILSMLVIPRRPDSCSRYRYLYMILQWVLLPISLIFFSAIPCIDAVTHLMRGKYLGFNVSVKKT